MSPWSSSLRTSSQAQPIDRSGDFRRNPSCRVQPRGGPSELAMVPDSPWRALEGGPGPRGEAVPAKDAGGVGDTHLETPGDAGSTRDRVSPAADLPFSRLAPDAFKDRRRPDLDAGGCRPSDHPDSPAPPHRHGIAPLFVADFRLVGRSYRPLVARLSRQDHRKMNMGIDFLLPFRSMLG